MDNLGWGLQMTAWGMGLVFGLLALLWALLTLVLRWDPPPAGEAADAADSARPAARPAAADAGADAAPALEPELVAAIVAATLAHRAHRRREAAPAMRSYWPGSLLYASRWVAAGRALQNRSWQRRSRP
jgi:Na+-transporting methylmalonyl-CoA/oxaloacetate decarboxylase gamma subunit